jgi:hypothetical protein
VAITLGQEYRPQVTSLHPKASIFIINKKSSLVILVAKAQIQETLGSAFGLWD